ncbi:hypothetical protein CSB45_01315 [candidate division KSB3 bacterium]|uniref:Uncharacterized protein n=1 Tax=candidate division KSB3 bacterium TaxID=2044937 RepID=A0A2G6EAE9_9BACT|nr:MAG: hypothetical protein CSB45_01315 [candidate division KSB3 bacterium]PIE30765.1 MAG: hypothetical protein CSA57_02035 [candidate division KSB3 bacterium]
MIVTIADHTKLIAFNASSLIGLTSRIRQHIANMQRSVQNVDESFESSTERIRQGAEHRAQTTKWLHAMLNGTTQTQGEHSSLTLL